jgi:hypothetical protein
MAIVKTKGFISLAAADASATAIFTGTLMVSGFYWDNGALGVADGTVSITDNAGNVVWSATSAAKNDEKSFSPATPIPVTGLKVPTLAAGVLFIYVDGANPQS